MVEISTTIQEARLEEVVGTTIVMETDTITMRKETTTKSTDTPIRMTTNQNLT